MVSKESGEVDQVDQLDGEVGGIFDEEYFLRGRQTGKSLYEDYRWLPDLTIPMVRVMAGHLKIHDNDLILDFGCARGYTVRAFREMGYKAWGYDVSRWALENADEKVKQYLIVNDTTLWSRGFDWIIAKDVLEHVPYVASVIDALMNVASRGLFVIVPLAPYRDQKYVIGDYELDVTHLHRLNLSMWAEMFMRPGWTVEVSYRVKGIKDKWYRDGWEKGNGFITARRIREDDRYHRTRC